MATTGLSGCGEGSWRSGLSTTGRLFHDLPPLQVAGTGSPKVLKVSRSSPSLRGRDACVPPRPTPLAARQSAVLLSQMTRHTAIGATRLLAPPADEVYRALEPRLRPDVSEVLARAKRGQHRGSHNEAMLAMLLFEHPPGGGGDRSGGQESFAPPLVIKGDSGEEGLTASENAARKVELRSAVTDVDVGAWVASTGKCFGRRSSFIPRRPSKLLTMAADPEVRRVMDSASWWTVLQKESAEALQMKGSLVPPKEYDDNRSADPRWVAAAVLAFPRASRVDLSSMSAPALGPALAIVCCWQHLRELVLADGPTLRGSDLGALAGCGLLSRLDVSRCKKLETLAHLHGVPRLSHVIARDCPSIVGEECSEDADSTPFASWPSLELLELQGCDRLGRLRLQLPKVVSLDLSDLPSLRVLDGELRGLLNLDLSFCGLSEIPSGLFRTCPSLADLTVQNCPELKVVSGLLKATALKRIRLSNCESLEAFAEPDDDAGRKTQPGKSSPRLCTTSVAADGRYLKNVMQRPKLHFLDLDGCTALSEETVWALAEPLLAMFPRSKEANSVSSMVTDAVGSATDYELMRAVNGCPEGDRGTIANFWATKASVKAARQAQANVQESKDAAAAAEAAVEAAAARATAAQEAAEAAAAQVQGAKKAAKAQEAADAAKRASDEAAADAAAAVEMARVAKLEAEAAPGRAASAKLVFVYVFRSYQTGVEVELDGSLDGVAFRALPSKAEEQQDLAIVFPTPDYCKAALASVGVDPVRMSEQAARIKLIEAIGQCRDIPARPSCRERVRASVQEAFQRADGVLNGAEDYTLLRSSIFAGLGELLPDLEVTCFCGSGARVRAADYAVYEICCSHLREL